MTILVVALTRDPHRQAEALRAALGLTLRGARVEVIAAAPLATPLAHRAAEALRSFGHAVTSAELAAEAASNSLGDALRRADRVEVWT
jgi:fructoselysine-6-P-deglycase FrlB-like protein